MKIQKTALCIVSFLLFLLFAFPSQAHASLMTDQQREIFSLGVNYFDLAVASCGPVSTGDNGITGALIGNDNAEKIWNYFFGKIIAAIPSGGDSVGRAANITAGIMGNLDAESNLSQTRRQGSTDLWNNRFEANAWGLAQWDGGRRYNPDSAFEAYSILGLIKTTKPHLLPYVEDYGEIDGYKRIPENEQNELLALSLDFLYAELQARVIDKSAYTQYGDTEWEGLLKQTTMQDALVFFHDNFERSDDTPEQVINNRGGKAQEWLNQFGGSVGCSTPTGDVVMPTDVEGISLTNPFGPSSLIHYDFHKGSDFTSNSMSVLAIQDGEVLDINTWCNYNVVTIKHADGLISGYWHMRLQNILVKPGDIVTAGQKIGVMGNEGCASGGDHIHLELDVTQVEGVELDRGTLRVTAPEKYAGLPLNDHTSNASFTRIDPMEYLRKYASNFPGGW